ncbi:MAG: heme-copper oxidase subunit III, partial [Cytophagaceae bacterium]
VYSVNPPNQLKIKLITLYWHFVDVLWVVLFVFLLFHHRVDWRL